MAFFVSLQQNSSKKEDFEDDYKVFYPSDHGIAPSCTYPET